jgi:glycosyltransferase involved in cell wall biosynthesis
MSAAVPRTGYVLKKYPRLSETFILNEILGVEAAGRAVDVWSLTPADEGRFHADLARVKAAVTYLPGVGSGSTLAAFEAVRDLGVSTDGVARALGFLGRLPAERRAGLLVQGLLIARAARERGVTHLHAHFLTVAAHAAYVARLCGGPTFSVTAHAKDVFRDAVDPAVFREVAEGARAVVTVCDYNRRFIAERFLAGSSARLVRIYNGLPLDELRIPPATREPGLILGVGRLVPKKGFDRLVRAAHALKARGVRARTVIVGDGEEREALRSLVAELGLSAEVTLTGPLPREDVLAWMAKARVLAAPCVRDDDGNQDALPTVLLEALAAGLPSVATPVAGVPEIVEDGAEGLLVPENDVPALATALARLLDDDATWRRMAGAGPAKARARFDRAATLPQLLAVFDGRS